MEVEEIAAYVNRITPPRLLRFVSEEGEKCCEECLKYHDLIFEEDDKAENSILKLCIPVKK